MDGTNGEIRIPRIAVGLVESRTDDNQESRARRGIKDFSIMALNGAGKETFRFSSNDRISRFNHMMDSDQKISTTLLHQSTTGGISWPVILSIIIAIVGVRTIAVAIQCYKKKHGLSWKCCVQEDDTDTEDSIVDPQ